MHRLPRLLVLLVGLCVIVSTARAQNVTVQSVTIYGLKKTRESIVRRELTFAEGDTIQQSELSDILERNRNNLLNLGIFNEAEINIGEWDTETNKVDIVVEVSELWYIYALPILEIADRNFNVWWNTYNGDLKRINLGGRLDYLNFSGRNDKLKAAIQVGYTPKQEIEYRFPYFNRKQSLGMTIGALHSINKEIEYRTIDNKEDFIKIDDDKLFERYSATVKLTYRPNFYLRHEVGFSFQHLMVDERIVTDYNPLFFRKGNQEHNAFSITYSYEYDDRDLKIYPTKGVKAQFEMEKVGWGEQDDENMLRSTITMEWNHPITPRFLHKLSGIGHYSLSRSRPSFYYYEGLGSGQKFVRGYELYVINGLDYLVGKYQLSYLLAHKQIKWGKFIFVEEFRTMPMKIYLSAHGETGHVTDPFTGDLNPLANRWIFGGGLGFNLLLYHNFLFQFNYNINDLGERGFFIHNQTSF